MYAGLWLTSADRFMIAPDLPLVEGQQFRRAPSKDDALFPFAFADTEPDGWGCRVIARDHAKRCKADAAAGKPGRGSALTEMDYLLGVDDMSHIGAIRLQDGAGNFLRTIESDGRGTPPLMELSQLIGASRAVEHGQWRLAPAFDINPFPDKDPELKLWLTEDYGPVDAIDAVFAHAAHFRLSPPDARHILGEVYRAVVDWKRIARSAAVGMRPAELDDFEPAFAHAQLHAAAALL